MRGYVISDLHGRYDLYQKLLEKLDLKENDRLFILGDCIDRGKDGIKIIKDAMKRPNVKCLLGNHEDMFLTFYDLKKKVGENEKEYIEAFSEQIELEYINGGFPTLKAFDKLPTEEQEQILNWIRELPYYLMVVIGDKTFYLSHTVPSKEKFTQLFTSNIDTEKDDHIWGKPEYNKVYSPDMYIVTGHTPTALIDNSQSGQIIEKNNHIAIDCGAFFLNKLGCFCLNTMEKIYIE